MAIDRTPVLKRCRSLDMDPVYLGVNKKSNRKLVRSSRKISEYGLQLREKQKAKFIYGVLEKPFRNYYATAERMKGLTGPNLMVLLESRLDNVVFRMGFARTRKEARQIVEIKENKKTMQRYKDIVEATGGVLVPAWLDADIEELKGTVKELPSRDMIDVPVNETLIVELYSK